ncbi:STAS domain-containing protein [Nonomuraea sp. NPDC049709]|uniref:STAS domain-containing protein n=1 Tax=Nonomuraea sp. NPDC049709 TaxID=3154736 RepID=UPI00343A440F
MDGTALDVLLHAHVLVCRSGAGLYLAGLQRAPAHLLRVTGVASPINVYNNLEEAICAALHAAQPSLAHSGRGVA